MWMRGIVRSLCLLLSLPLRVCSLEVIEFIPEKTSKPETRQISVKGPLRLICKGENTNWQYEEGLHLPDRSVESVLDDNHILDIEQFNESMDGHYSCLIYDPPKKKRMRLYFYDNVIPEGYHKCGAEERSRCSERIKACIAADGYNATTCLCFKHWYGPRCDISEFTTMDHGPRGSSIPSFLFLTLFVGVLAGIIGVIVLIVVTCKNRRRKSESARTTEPEPLMLPLMLR